MVDCSESNLILNHPEHNLLNCTPPRCAHATGICPALRKKEIHAKRQIRPLCCRRTGAPCRSLHILLHIGIGKGLGCKIVAGDELQDERLRLIIDKIEVNIKHRHRFSFGINNQGAWGNTEAPRLI